MIAAGRVFVNGRKAAIGQDINSNRDIITIDGERISTVKRVESHYILLYKPRGYVTTMSDELGRRCISDLVDDIPARVYPIGRLDRDSEGMILLTNDGNFANYVMHPKNEVGKTYRVTIDGIIEEDKLIALSTGVQLEDGKTLPARVEVLVEEPNRTVLSITIREGRNRQIRRMCEKLGLTVARLKRVSIGPVRLGMLKPGQWRNLTKQELMRLRK